jgi:hypothetical protein
LLVVAAVLEYIHTAVVAEVALLDMVSQAALAEV